MLQCENNKRKEAINIKQLFQFIKESPSAFHTVDTVKRRLLEKGFIELFEQKHWELISGKNYFTIRNGSSMIAFQIPEGSVEKFHIAAAHSDFPTFKLKENPELNIEKKYTVLNIEKYGGMLCAPWFDRPLSIAGRVAFEQEGKIITRLVNIDRDLVVIPNLAIHMNHKANENCSYNIQKDMLPLFAEGIKKESLKEIIAKQVGLLPQDILCSDLFLYNRMEGTQWGESKEFISAPRLDDLQCAYALLEGFLQADHKTCIPVYALFDNEEVGSQTKQGAGSTFLSDVLFRISDRIGKSKEEHLCMIACSFMISADNAHAFHPNFQDKSDPINRPVLNKGIVIKYNANQKYTTDAVSSSYFQMLCKRAKIPCQPFFNRSDMTGGSTLGNISNGKVSLNTVDIGLAQLAMHSPYETAGSKDTEYLTLVMKEFYSI